MNRWKRTLIKDDQTKTKEARGEYGSGPEEQQPRKPEEKKQ